MNHKFFKLTSLLVISAFMLILLNACTQQSTNNNMVVVADIPAATQPTINVGETVNSILQETNIVTTALGPNLLINSAFDQGTSGWQSCGAATSYTLTNDSVNGQAAKLSTGCFYQTVAVSVNTQLSLSCKAKVVDATGWSGLGFGFTNSSYTIIAEAPTQSISGGEYKEYVTTQTAPANTAYASVWIYTDGTIHIDDCSLTTGAPTAPPGNLLSNASFTSNADWYNCGNANNWNIASGNLNITGTACIYQTNNAQANLDYTLSCKSKRTGNVYTSFILNALDSNYASVGQKIAVIENTNIQEKQISLTVPENTKYIATTFYGEGTTQHQECSLTADGGNTPTQQAPNVAITSPSNGITLENGSGVNVQASASDVDGSINNVKLYINDQLVAQDNAAPYQWNNDSLLQNLAQGSYSLRVEATDNDGLTATNTITFQVASPAVPTTGAGAKGKWSGVQSWPVNASHVANLPDGRILAWATFDEGNLFPANANSYDQTFTHATIFDPFSGTFEETDHPSHDMFCAGLVTLSDGTVVAAGGGFDNTGNRDKVSFFKDYAWQTTEDMPSKHWYPTAYADTNDNVLVSLGTSSGGKSSYMSNDGNWINMPGVNLAGTSSGSKLYYPALHTSPRGTVFHSGPTTEMHELTIGSTSSTTTSVGSRNQDGVTGEAFRLWSNIIMIDEGKIFITGGKSGNSSFNTSVMVDINDTDPIVTKKASMNYSRTFHSTLLLPNGEVLVVGGNGSAAQFSDNQSRLIPEIYSPVTDTWRDVAAMTIPRNYHSTAILLQDGRVLAAGGGLCGCDADHQDGQIYSPPYLFNADGSVASRPVIASAPAALGYNQNFNVTITGAGSNNITRFSMIRLSASTHHFNMDLRQDSLSFSNQGNGNYQVKTHSNKNVVTPGYYFLFASNASGVPSVAKIVKIGSGPGAPPTVLAEPDVNQLPVQVSAINASNAWGIGMDASNKIYKSTDGGSSWQLTNTGSLAVDISAVNANTAWIIGTDKKIYKTNNGGTNWALTNTGALAVNISAVDANTAWIIGTNNKIYKTINGGASWSLTNTTIVAKQVAAVDTNTAWTISTDDKIYRTTNGGGTWQLTNTGALAVDISAVNANTAWITGTNDKIYKTTNSGANWSLTNTGALAKQITAVDASNAWIIGTNDKVYRTTNGGSSWQIQN